MLGYYFTGPLAHRVEQGTFNPKVPGSSPGRPTGMEFSETRQLYELSARCFVDIVSLINQDSYKIASIGSWNLEELISHSLRAITLVKQYLNATDTGQPVFSLYDYLNSIKQADNEAIYKRAKEFAKTLDGCLKDAVVGAYQDVITLLRNKTGREMIFGPNFKMELNQYLPTRIFELTVHTLDICDTVSVDYPNQLADPVKYCVNVILNQFNLLEAAELLKAMTNRSEKCPTII